jgi:hypothetical protein
MPSDSLEVRDRRRGFLWMPNSLFDEFVKRMEPSALVAYLTLARLANNSDQTCFPSYETIAEMSGLSRRTIASALNQLRELGVIDWTKDGRHNVYVLLDTNSATTALVQSGAPTSAKSSTEQCSPLHPNKTNNKTIEQDFSIPSESSNIVDLKLDTHVSDHPKRKPASDPRHAPFKEKLIKFWQHLNPEIDGYYWTAGDAKQLAEFLKAYKALTLEQLHEALKHYKRSDGVVYSKTVRQFLPYLNLYFDGSLNRFGKPLEESHAQA